ncbi:hypothetical protein [Paenibacillus sp. Soil724D2]|uniref:hypothetical protein n=1 Tax=Paenibacillus sp. (strain Soil724D2) TaxID=1736392 RepID=UPI000714D91A|nr:hypothetical protein [Paenibacillus sp. Soil724D2]KRE46655.1 hypothetical protein ASG85_28795 [Paenibacillus sp. Soil724D2]
MKVSHSKWIAALIVIIILLVTLSHLDKVSAAVLPGSSGVSVASIEVTVKNTESQPISSAKVFVTSESLPFPLRIQLDGVGHGKNKKIYQLQIIASISQLLDISMIHISAVK